MEFENSIRQEEQKLMQELSSMKFSFRKILKAMELNALLHSGK